MIFASFKVGSRPPSSALVSSACRCCRQVRCDVGGEGFCIACELDRPLDVQKISGVTLHVLAPAHTESEARKLLKAAARAAVVPGQFVTAYIRDGDKLLVAWDYFPVPLGSELPTAAAQLDLFGESAP